MRGFLKSPLTLIDNYAYSSVSVATTAKPAIRGSRMGVIFLLFLAACVPGTRGGEIVNDITQLNPIKVDRVVTPKSTEEISALIRNSTGAIRRYPNVDPHSGGCTATSKKRCFQR